MNIKRNEFIKKFTDYFNYDNERRFYLFNLFTKSADDDLEFNENLNILFYDFFHELNIKNSSKILQELKLNKCFDFDYSEENPGDDDLCCFNCSFNINLLFDLIIEKNIKHENIISVFRVETPIGKGLYDGFFASKKVDLSINPSPIDDLNFIGIFDRNHNDFVYQKNWYFGFSNLNDLKSWCIDDETIKKFKESNYFIKEYLIDENFVIKGNKQLIFKKDNSNNYLIKNFDVLDDITNTSKKLFNI